MYIELEIELAAQKRLYLGKSVRSQTGPASGRDHGDQRLDPDDVYYSGKIIGQNREGHLGGHFWEGFGQEVRRTHARLHGAERMLDGFPT